MAQVLREVAGLHYALHQYAQAVDAATAALAIQIPDRVAYRIRGLAHDAMNNRAQAVQDLQRAAQLGDVEAQRTLQAWGETW